MADIQMTYNITTRIKEIAAAMEGKSASVGWYQQYRYEDGTPIAEVASIQEFGSPTNNIPPRSFMRASMHEGQDDLRTFAAKSLEAFANGSLSVNPLEPIAERAKSMVAKKITEITTPELSKSTIAARARRQNLDIDSVSKKPLIDTGMMLAHLSYEVTGDER